MLLILAPSMACVHALRLLRPVDQKSNITELPAMIKYIQARIEITSCFTLQAM